MKTSTDEFASVLERLSRKVEELETRLSALEQRSREISPPSSAATQPLPALPGPLGDLSTPRLGTALAVLGRFFLGIAGAYLLRALAESGALPRLAVVGVALVYAIAWLVWATQSRSAGNFARVGAAITAALILSPMLWELTMSFHIMPAPVTATALAGFAVLAVILGWKRNLPAIPGFSTLAVSVTALGLLVATRDVVPFVIALLVIALLEEVAACRDRWLSWRAVAAAALDSAAMALILVYTQPEGASPEYKPVLTPVLLALFSASLAIYAGSMLFRTVVLKRRISIFEIGQTSAAFVLATVGILRLSSAAGRVLGALCLLASAGLYYVVYGRSSRILQSRNYHVFSAWAAVLFLAGSFFLFPTTVRGPWLAAAALVATFAGVRSSRTTLMVHGAIFLMAGAIASALVDSATRVLIADLPTSGNSLVWILGAAVLLSYFIAARVIPEHDIWKERVLRLVFAAMAVYVALALGVVLIAWLLSLMTAVNDKGLAIVRTLTFCLAALGLAFAGSRWSRIELIWLAYAAMVFCALKLLFEDLRLGSASLVAGSLFCYGAAWMLVPRLTRKPASV